MKTRYLIIPLILGALMTARVQAQSYLIGPMDPTIGASASFTALVQYSLFDVLSPAGIIIDSVNVYPTSGPGSPFTVVVQNSAQTVIASWSGVTTVASGLPQRIPLNLFIPQGTGYRWGFSVNPGMLRNSTGSAYPYTVPGLMSITGNTFNVAYYYFFYKIRIRLPFPPVADDAESWQVTNPAGPVSPGIDTIKVSIKNLGSDTLTSANLGWSVNGIQQTGTVWER